MNEGIKHDAEKPRIDLLPFEALEEVAKVLTFGAERDAAKLKEIMCAAPAWGADMRLAVDIHTGKRWTKS